MPHTDNTYVIFFGSVCSQTEKESEAQMFQLAEEVGEKKGKYCY